MDSRSDLRALAEKSQEAMLVSPSTILALLDENETLRAALDDIIAVEPRSASSRLDVMEWAEALDKAQNIARDVVARVSDPGNKT